MQKTNDQLVVELSRGDRSAFTVIYNQLFDKVFQFALSLVGRVEAEDIVADLFAKLWVKRAEFQDVINIQNFLMVSVRNACLNHLRGARRHQEIKEDLIKSTDQIEQLENNIEIRSLWKDLVTRRVFQLPAQCQKIFRHAYLDGLTNAEIARLLHISEKTVSNQKIRGIQLLREIAQGHLALLIWFLVK